MFSEVIKSFHKVDDIIRLARFSRFWKFKKHNKI